MNRKKILFFIGTLGSGGKERRLIELLKYLKVNTYYEMLVVLRQNHIDYPTFYELNIPYKLLTDNYKKKDARLPLNFYKICSEFLPDIIHTWGAMPASVAWPTTFLKRIPLVNSQITNAPPSSNVSALCTIQNKINFLFSDVILSNSKAGLNSYHPPISKSKVIYNGINLERFDEIDGKKSVQEKYNIHTPYAVIMVASFSDNKDFDLFVNIAIRIARNRENISFICVGDGIHFKRIKDKAKVNQNIIFTGRINEVEALINVSDIGVLLSNKEVHGEGISNSITEYMALGKPVIANDTGGTVEIVQHGVNGFLVTDEQEVEIADIIVRLIDDKKKRKAMGQAARNVIETKFNIENIGAKFVKVYKGVLPNTS